MGETDKFAAMIGFAKRARKIIYGYDALKSAKHIKLLAVSATASDNLTGGMKLLAARLGVTLVTVAALEDIAGGNCKALGIIDDNMARAMLDFAASGAQGYKI